ncbi:MAG: hypothetical protein JWP59_865 [Massilia sp.]|nr:hypothetical protein [Massilia sp.]
MDHKRNILGTLAQRRQNDRLGTADAAVGARFNQAQQFYLHCQWHVADFNTGTAMAANSIICSRTVNSSRSAI